MDNQDKRFVDLAIEKARQSVTQGGFPAGAILVKDNVVVGEGISIGNILQDCTSHGEMVAIRQACASLKSSDLTGSVLYSSMQPCLMCFGASMYAGLKKLVFACSKEGVSSNYYGGDYSIDDINHKLLNPIEIVHVSEMEKHILTIIKNWEKNLLPA